MMVHSKKEVKNTIKVGDCFKSRSDRVICVTEIDNSHIATLEVGIKGDIVPVRQPDTQYLLSDFYTRVSREYFYDRLEEAIAKIHEILNEIMPEKRLIRNGDT